jgi:hypothetical protein
LIREWSSPCFAICTSTLSLCLVHSRSPLPSSSFSLPSSLTFFPSFFLSFFLFFFFFFFFGFAIYLFS